MRLKRTKTTKEYGIVAGVLDALQGAALTGGEILDVFLSGYGESYRKVKRGIYSSKRAPRESWGERYGESQKLYATLNRLKRDGLIEKTDRKKGRASIWKLTKKGEEKRKQKSDPSGNRYGEEATDDHLKIVIFDIPETEKQKRTWLRHVLAELEFTILQKSVWIGTRRLPRQFIIDLQKAKLTQYIHIFEVKKGGTIADVFALPPL